MAKKSARLDQKEFKNYTAIPDTSDRVMNEFARSDQHVLTDIYINPCLATASTVVNFASNRRSAGSVCVFFPFS